MSNVSSSTHFVELSLANTRARKSLNWLLKHPAASAARRL
jgi:hypothetical protein